MEKFKNMSESNTLTFIFVLLTSIQHQYINTSIHHQYIITNNTSIHQYIITNINTSILFVLQTV